ncbi:MAG: hypothetical protein OXI49_17750 [Acidobacteriota bacterium]|nr:hypothetical protein [Acidobacteriota bacterium]
MKHLFPLALLLSLAIGPVGAETLYNKDGVQMSATARPIEPGAATCRIREERHSTAEYERLKPNDGQPLDVWRVELVVANYSGRVLDYLNAHLNVKSDWPPCDHWDGPESSYGPQQVKWTGPLMTIHEVGSVQPGEERREIRFVLAWHDDDPVLGRWDINYTFEDSPPEAGGGSEAPVRQAIPDPLDPARGGAQFQPDETCADVSFRKSCWIEIENHPGCYVWNPFPQTEETITWSGGCTGGRPSGTGELAWSFTDSGGKPRTSSHIGEMRDGQRHGHWVDQSASFEGYVDEGSYVDDKRHGYWISKDDEGHVFFHGPYVGGKAHGRWTSDIGGVLSYTCYSDGDEVPCP